MKNRISEPQILGFLRLTDQAHFTRRFGSAFDAPPASRVVGNGPLQPRCQHRPSGT